MTPSSTTLNDVIRCTQSPNIASRDQASVPHQILLNV